jgi:hypothetical protein
MFMWASNLKPTKYHTTMTSRNLFTIVFLLLGLFSCKKEEVGDEMLQLTNAFIGAAALDLVVDDNNVNLPVDQAISLVFSAAINTESANESISLSSAMGAVEVNLTFSSGDKSVAIFPNGVLENNVTYQLEISAQLKGMNGESFAPVVINFKTVAGTLKLLSVMIDAEDVLGQGVVTDVSLDFSVTLNFSFAVDQNIFKAAISLIGSEKPGLAFTFSNADKTVEVTGDAPLKYLTKYFLEISDELVGALGEPFEGYDLTFYSAMDTTPKFPEISDEELLTKVQEQTFKFFWDFGHPVSGLTRERNTSGETVASGGSGFGMMAIVTGIERGFITRAEGIDRLKTMVEFLGNADRFHGAWSHWLNGTTGKVIPFSTRDNGGDLVETSYVIMGMLTVRQYLNDAEPNELDLTQKINQLVGEVEWDWYTQGETSLTWHWSPNYNFEMNLKIRGWNEALITYALAAASETHGISKQVYDGGWKNSSHFINGKKFYDITLPLGTDYGGPLFFEHYSFLGIDPQNLRDDQVNYWEQAVNHTLINRAHCIVNPRGYVGYGENCWGLTASDGNTGYSAHSPTNDRGVITPSAALSSFPFTPTESMDVIKHLYYGLGDRIWGPYGFYDAFNVTEEWYASSNIAVDQGPIMIMIENHRTGLVWDLFMSCPEVQQALSDLGFTY